MRAEYGALGPRLVTDAGQPLLPAVPSPSARVTASWGATPHPTREVVELAARLLFLARQVDRLGYSGRHGPEDFVATKLSVARELRSLSPGLDTAGGTR